METRATRTAPRRRGWVFGLVCFALGMAAMWGFQQVDVLSIFRSGASTEEELARAAFEALRAGDYDAFDAHVPKESHFEKLIARIREQGSESDRKRMDRRIERDGGAAGGARKNRERIRSKFAETIDQSRRKGLDWKGAEYAGLNRKTTRMKERYGWRGGDIRFLVRSNGKTFEFELDDCTCVDGSWLIGSGIRLVRRRSRGPDPVTGVELDSVAPESEPVLPDPDAGMPATEPAVVTEPESPRGPGR